MDGMPLMYGPFVQQPRVDVLRCCCNKHNRSVLKECAHASSLPIPIIRVVLHNTQRIDPKVGKAHCSRESCSILIRLRQFVEGNAF